MGRSQIIGTWGENIAFNYLQEQNVNIIKRNYTCRFGEIDLIAKDGEFLVFVEVRVRNKEIHGHAAETITHHKQSKIIRSAQFYMLQNNFQGACRIDVIAIDGHSQMPQINWIKNAF